LNFVTHKLFFGASLVHDIREEEGGEDEDDEHDSIVCSLPVHTQLLPEEGTEKMKLASCRTVEFSIDGQRIYTGGAAGDLCAIDAERACTFSAKPKKGLLWSIDQATEGKLNPLLAIHPFEQSALLATGDDAGGVRVWDERICGQHSTMNGSSKRPQGCVLSWKENDDYISALETSQDGNTLLATSADCRLSIFDLRMARDPNTRQKSVRVSDDQEDELLSLKIMKNGKKVVCGTGEGVLEVFSWGTWGDCSDRFPGHPSSVEALLKIDEDTLLTGSFDGWIRVVQIHPDKILGVLGEDHGGFPIEKLGFNSNRDVVGSVSHDNYVRLWDARHLREDYEDDEDSDDGEEQAKVSASQEGEVSAAQKASAGNGSDDDWEDMDDDEDEKDSDVDSDDSGDEEEKAPTTNDKRKERLQTENDKFFDDM
jgi:WD40 repeat protein